MFFTVFGDILHQMKIYKATYPSEHVKTKTQRGWPHTWIALFDDGRPRVTGLKNTDNIDDNKQGVTKSMKGNKER